MGAAVGVGVAGAMTQEGRPWQDIAFGLPVEFGSFGIVPATEIMQNWRIRDDLEKKGLSLKKRNEAMDKYSRAKTQEAIDKDEVGLESWALSGLKEGETKEQAYSIREDEENRLLKKKIERGFDVETGTWPDRDPIAFEEAMLAEGGPVVPRVAYKDGSNWLDKLSDDDVANLGRGWKRDYKMDPDVMDRIKQKQILDAQEANEAGFKTSKSIRRYRKFHS